MYTVTNSGTISQIKFWNGPLQTGGEYTGIVLTAGVTNLIYAAGYDSQTNYIADISVRAWSTNTDSVKVASS